MVTFYFPCTACSVTCLDAEVNEYIHRMIRFSKF